MGALLNPEAQPPDDDAPAAPASAELEALTREAAGDGAPPIPSPQEARAAEAGSAATRAGNAAMVRGTLAWAVSVGEKKYPGMVAVWPAPALDAVSEQSAVVLEKYGVTMPDWLKRWEAEIGLAILLWPLMAQTGAIIKAANEKAAPAPGAPAAGVTVQVPEPPPAPPAAGNVTVAWSS